MRKDHLRDYATNAFRAYAAAGCPTYDDLRQRLITDVVARGGSGITVKGGVSTPTEAAVMAAETRIDNAVGLLADLLAVIRTVDLIGKRGDSAVVMDCLHMVYFADPLHDLAPGDITARVIKASLAIPVDARTVYRKLRKARDMFSVERGLNVVTKVGLRRDILTTVVRDG